VVGFWEQSTGLCGRVAIDGEVCPAYDGYDRGGAQNLAPFGCASSSFLTGGVLPFFAPFFQITLRGRVSPVGGIHLAKIL
jgi:hypothetical protein